MKRLIILITCFLLINGCKKYDNNSIIGTWKTAKSDYPILIFKSNNTYEFVLSEDNTLKNDFTLSGNVLTLKDKFDLVYNVITLDETNLHIRMNTDVNPISSLYLFRVK